MVLHRLSPYCPSVRKALPLLHRYQAQLDLEVENNPALVMHLLALGSRCKACRHIDSAGRLEELARMASLIAAGMAKVLQGDGTESLEELAAAGLEEHYSAGRKGYSQTCRLWLREFTC